MKKILLALALISMSAFAQNSVTPNHPPCNDPLDPTCGPTVIHNVTIDYVRELSVAQSAPNQDFSEYFAAIGGRVDFTGTGPVYVTTRIGGQDYSAVTDQNGFYSFLIWVNAGEFTVDAWVTGGRQPTVQTQTRSITYHIGQ